MCRAQVIRRGMWLIDEIFDPNDLLRVGEGQGGGCRPPAGVARAFPHSPGLRGLGPRHRRETIDYKCVFFKRVGMKATPMPVRVLRSQRPGRQPHRTSRGYQGAGSEHGDREVEAGPWQIPLRLRLWRNDDGACPCWGTRATARRGGAAASRGRPEGVLALSCRRTGKAQRCDHGGSNEPCGPHGHHATTP
jgi:hypothetical protein